MKKIAKALALCMSLTFALSACSSKADSSSSEAATTTAGESSSKAEAAMEPTTINIRVMNEFANLDSILDVYKEKVKDDPILSQITLNFSYVAGADYKDKLSLAVSAQEDYDLMFCGSWQGLSNYVQQGAFKDVSSYFNNDDFPGLKVGFSESFLNAAKTGDKLYTIPVADCFEDLRGATYREDLRIKYNLPEITDLATFTTYLDKMTEVKDAEGLVDVWSLSSQGFMTFLNPRFQAAQANVEFADGIGTTFINWFIGLNEDGTKVQDAYMLGDSEEHYKNFTAPFNTDFMGDYYEKLPEYLKYTNQDSATNKEAGTNSDFKLGLSAVGYNTLGNYSTALTDLQQNVPDAQIGFYVFDDDQRNMEKGAIVNELKSNNFMVVPNWSEKTDAVMYFLNWLQGSQENHDLFQYGIEGTHWKAVGDNAIEIPTLTEDTKYTFPAYTMTLNPNYIRYNSKVLDNDKIKALCDYDYSAETYTASPLSGFTFDPTNVKTEQASVNALATALMVQHGVYGDKTAETIKQYNKDATDVGLDTIRAEIVKQAQAFLDAKK